MTLSRLVTRDAGTAYCPSPNDGWLLTCDGARPHIGRTSGASLGTKALVQIFGAPRWAMRYEDD